MVRAPAQGDVWWAEAPELGRRTMLVVTRDAALPVLNRVLVAPVTRTVRRIPTEVALALLADIAATTLASMPFTGSELNP